MQDTAGEGRIVRLRAGQLLRLMEARGLSARRLHALAGEPSKRTINRWLKEGRGAPDGLVSTSWRCASAVADALGVSTAELLDASPAEDDLDMHRGLRLAAGLGPRVFPELLEALGVGPEGLLDVLAPYLEPEDDDGRVWRFVRWAYCEDIIKDQTLLPASYARRALAWGDERGLGAAAAPELRCLCAVALDDTEVAWAAGLGWMRQAMGRGVFAEAAWAGERLQRLGAAGVPLALRADVTLLLAQVLSVSGRAPRALDLLIDLALDAAARPDPLLQGRIQLGLARVRPACGQLRGGVADAERAVALLDRPGAEALPHLLEAQMELVYLAERAGLGGKVHAALAGIDRLMRRPGDVPVARVYRLRGIGALSHGDVAAALEHFLLALDVAQAHGDHREVGAASLHTAIAFALQGEAEHARAYFEQAVAHVASGETGSLLTAAVHLNFGEFTLEQGELAACRRHLEIALAHFQKAGDFPTAVSHTYVLLAEAASVATDYAEARVFANRAYRHAVVADHPLFEAEALAVQALASIDQPREAEAWCRAAEDILGRLPDSLQVLERFMIERRCAEARSRSRRSAKLRADLERLRAEADRMGLDAQRRRLERLISS